LQELPPSEVIPYLKGQTNRKIPYFYANRFEEIMKIENETKKAQL
jgi:hypothetical protein